MHLHLGNALVTLTTFTIPQTLSTTLCQFSTYTHVHVTQVSAFSYNSMKERSNAHSKFGMRAINTNLREGGNPMLNGESQLLRESITGDGG